MENNPYVGPVPFGPADGDRFFGRDEEVSDLLSLVSAYAATLLYAQSGAGKTSLLEAKLLPELEARGGQVLGKRREDDQVPAPARVSAPRGESLKTNVRNIFVANLLLSLGVEPKRAAKMTIADYIKETPQRSTDSRISIPPLRLLVIDQFEELFTSPEEQWPGRRELFAQIGHALEANRRLRVLFGMREEWIARVDRYVDEMPEALRIRLRLERLGETAAKDAIAGPARQAGVSIDDDVALELVSRLRGSRSRRDVPPSEFVEPLHLQLVCKRIWKSLPAGSKEITSKVIKMQGDLGEALTEYYDDCIRDILKEFGEQFGIVEGTLRNRFERSFITPEGTRLRIRPSALEESARLPTPILDKLDDLYVIRSTEGGGEPAYELSHDRFIEPVLKSNAAFRQQQERSETHRRVEEFAMEWARRSRPQEGPLLLSGRDLYEAKQWLPTVNLEAYGSNADIIKEYVQASDNVYTQESQRRRIELLAMALGAVILIAAIVGYNMLQAEKLSAKTYESALSKAETKVAQSLLVQAQPLDALGWAVKAASHSTVSDEAGSVLRDAVESASSVWLPRQSNAVRAMNFSPDSTRLLTLTERDLCVWDALSGQKVFCRPANAVTGNFSSGGRWITLRESPFRTSVLNATTGQKNDDLSSRFQDFFAAFGPGDDRVAVIRKLILTLEPTGSRLPIVKLGRLDSEPTSAPRFTADGKLLAVNDGSKLRLYQTQPPFAQREIAIRSPGTLTRLSPDGRYAAVMEVSDLEVIDLQSGKRWHANELASPILFSADGTCLVTLAYSPFSPRIKYLQRFRTSDGARLGNIGLTNSYTSEGGVVDLEHDKSDTTVSVVNGCGPIVRKTLRNANPDLARLSPDQRLLATREGADVRIRRLDQAEHDYAKDSIAQLREAGCTQLRRIVPKLERDVDAACPANK